MNVIACLHYVYVQYMHKIWKLTLDTAKYATFYHSSIVKLPYSTSSKCHIGPVKTS